MTGYVRKFEGNTIMFFKIRDKELLKNIKNMEKSYKFIKHKI